MSSAATPNSAGPSRLPHLAGAQAPTAPSTSGDSESTALPPPDRGLDTGILKELARSALVEKLNDVSCPSVDRCIIALADSEDTRSEDVDSGSFPCWTSGLGDGSGSPQGQLIPSYAVEMHDLTTYRIKQWTRCSGWRLDH